MIEQSESWTVRRLLEWTGPFFARKGVDSPRLSAELLLAHIFGVPRIKLYTDLGRVVGAGDLANFRQLVKRAVDQEPIAYLTGRAHFFNLEFEVNRDVLIPRPDTETLVAAALELIRHEPGLEAPRVLDLCTGSGCVAAAIAKNAPQAMVFATDISSAAVAIARRNVEKLGLSGRVIVERGDLYEPLKTMVDRQPFELILANPPYIPTEQIARLDASVKDFEPITALDGGPDGLAFHRRILADAPAHLARGGRVMLEIAFDQGPAAMELAKGYECFGEAMILKDLAGNDRVVSVRWP